MANKVIRRVSTNKYFTKIETKKEKDEFASEKNQAKVLNESELFDSISILRARYGVLDIVSEVA